MGDNLKHESSRYWLITINNPLDYGFEHTRIKDILNNGAEIRYWCMSDEIGDEGTFHTHIYAYWIHPMRFNTLRKKFDDKSHITYPVGTPQQNRDYVFKEGKWLDDPKGDTNIRDSHEEYGECPVHRPGSRTDLSGLYDLIKEGKSNYEILEIDPNYIKQIERIDKVRKTLQEERLKECWRNLEVTYIWGSTGSGKTRYVMDLYGYSNVYRVTDYKNPFDGYKGQDVILFEEFRSSLKIEDMLKYLDGYPVELACRYSNQQAGFTKVYFSTNIDLRYQYPNIQREESQTWKAFLRRIHTVKVYYDSGNFYDMDTENYMKEMYHFFIDGTEKPKAFDYPMPDEDNLVDYGLKAWVQGSIDWSDV